MKKTFFIKTLGCKVNSYESEYIKSLFLSEGYTLDENAFVYIVNTCTVTNESDVKSRKVINSIRKNNPNSILIVVGCYSQYKYKQNSVDIDADIILGNKDKSKIIDYLNEFIKTHKQIIKFYDLKNDEFENMNINNYSNHVRANIKIEDGCNNYCSYCIIPYVRGDIRSKHKEKILCEVKSLVKNDYKEIVLTGIHIGEYKDNNYDLSDLLNDLCNIDNLKRIRLSSIEIVELNDKILSLFKENKKITPHFHIPLQSGCDKILKLMNRRYDINEFVNIVNKIRKIDQSVSLSTDIIVGFPGETDEDFKETYNFAKKMKFSKIHVFPYSDREGTVASKIKDKVPNFIKKQRVKKLLELSNELSNEYNSNFINKELNVLIENKKEDYYYGYTENYIMVKLKGDYKINEIVKIKLNKEMLV